MSVNERVKDAPANVLRAMFAGIGQLLGMADKLRKSAASQPAPAAPGAAAPETTAAQTAAEPAAAESASSVTLVADPAAAQTTVAEPAVTEPAPTGTAAPAVTEPAAGSAATPATAELPLANYDELTIASLRARLRNLSADQLGQLIEYEKGHAGRADVVTMFERRIAKLAEG